MGLHQRINMEFMVDDHPYHFFRGIHRPSGILGGAVGVVGTTWVKISTGSGSIPTTAI